MNSFLHYFTFEGPNMADPYLKAYFTSWNESHNLSSNLSGILLLGSLILNSSLQHPRPLPLSEAWNYTNWILFSHDMFSVITPN